MQASATGPATTFSCGTATLTSGLKVTYTCVAGGRHPHRRQRHGTPSGCVVSGSIDTGDPTQTDRLFRSGVPQTCPPTTTCATFGDGLPRHYDEYTFTNTTGSTQCVTVDTDTACTGTNFIFIASYLGSFDPANICTNWIGDSGSSPNSGASPYQFNLDDGQTVVIVVSEVTPDAGCAGYTVTCVRDLRRRRITNADATRAYQGHPTAQPVRGQQVPRIRQRSCVMASSRLPLTSTCSAVWTTAHHERR